MSSVEEALRSPVTLPPATLKPSPEEVLVRLQRLRLQHARRSPVDPQTPLGLSHEAVVDTWALAGLNPVPQSAQHAAPVAMAMPLLQAQFAMALVGQRVGAEVRFPLSLPLEFPLREMRGASITQVVRVQSAATLEVPSEQDPAFWKATGLGTSLDEVMAALAKQITLQQLARMRGIAIDTVLLTLATRLDLSLPSEELARRKLELFERLELPRWAGITAGPDMARLRAAWTGSSTVHDWALRDATRAAVVTQLHAAKKIQAPDGNAINLAGDAAVAIGDQLLDLLRLTP